MNVKPLCCACVVTGGREPGEGLTEEPGAGVCFRQNAAAGSFFRPGPGLLLADNGMRAPRAGVDVCYGFARRGAVALG